MCSIDPFLLCTDFQWDHKIPDYVTVSSEDSGAIRMTSGLVLGTFGCRLEGFLVRCASLRALHDRRPRERAEGCEVICEDDNMISSWGW